MIHQIKGNFIFYNICYNMFVHRMISFWVIAWYVHIPCLSGGHFGKWPPRSPGGSCAMPPYPNLFIIRWTTSVQNLVLLWKNAQLVRISKLIGCTITEKCRSLVWAAILSIGAELHGDDIYTKWKAKELSTIFVITCLQKLLTVFDLWRDMC